MKIFVLMENGWEAEENGVEDRKKTGQCSFCLLVQGAKISLEENLLLYRDIDRVFGKKVYNTKLSDIRPPLGLERKCMGWECLDRDQI